MTPATNDTGLSEVFPAQPAGSDLARDVDLLLLALIAFSIITILIVGVIAASGVYRYHWLRDTDRSGQSTGHPLLEFSWIGALFLIGLGLFAWSATLYSRQLGDPEDAPTVYVVGKQWMWKLHHAGGREEINELHVPIGQTTRLVMTSQDVIHSFFLPAMRAKQDVLPGRYTTLWFTPDRAGVFPIYCAEYCGDEHSRMKGRLYVLSEADYSRWLNATPDAKAPGSPGTPGAPLAVGVSGAFRSLGCIACHVPNDSVLAPRLDGIYARNVKLADGRVIAADDQYLRESILDPNAKIAAGYPSPSLMPSYQGVVTENQLRELIDFIRSIEHGWPADAIRPPAAPPPSPLQEGPR